MKLLSNFSEGIRSDLSRINFLACLVFRQAFSFAEILRIAKNCPRSSAFLRGLLRGQSVFVL